MFFIEVIGKWTVLLVPLLPLPALVTSDQQNRTSLDIECVQDSKFRPSLRRWSQLLHILVPGSLHAVGKRPTKLWTALFKQFKSCHDKVI